MANFCQTRLTVVLLWTLILMQIFVSTKGVTLVPLNGYVLEKDAAAVVGCEIVYGVEEPKISYTMEWFKDEVNLKDFPEFVSSTSKNDSIGKLTNKDINEHISGTYRCQIKDPVTDAVVADANPEIFIKARIGVKLDHGEKSLTAKAGSDVQLYFTVIAWPEPLELNCGEGEDVEADNVTVVQNKTQLHDGFIEVVLTMKNINITDRGHYGCYARQMFNETEIKASNEVMVRVKDPLAALYPFIGIMIEILLLAIVIIAYEVNKRKKQKQKENRDSAQQSLLNSNAAGSRADDGKEIRQRK